jgi:hypothetical protein
VYTWFLSADEAPEKQVAFFKEHGLDLLASTLEHDMRQLPSANDVADAQAPFKIFLSLLDKWEIGEWLSDRLAIPSLEASRETAVAGHQDEVSCMKSTQAHRRFTERHRRCTRLSSPAYCGSTSTRAWRRTWRRANLW